MNHRAEQARSARAVVLCLFRPETGTFTDMALGDHPQRTPFYGVVLLLVVLISGLWVHNLPNMALQVLVYIALFAIAAVAFIMTFRDYSR